VQNVTGTNLATNWKATDATPVCHVYADWDGDGDYNLPDEDLTDYVLKVNVTHRLLDPVFGLPVLGAGRPAEATITLNNAGHRYSPENASGLAGTYTSISQQLCYRVPVVIDMGYVDTVNGEEVTRQFTGQIEGVQPAEAGGQRQLVYTCRGREALLERLTLDTGALQDQRIDKIIAMRLSGAGMTSMLLDRALFTLPYEWSDSENLLAHLQDLAAADGGWLYWSKEGQARFERATHWLEGTHPTVVETLTTGLAVRQDQDTSWRNIYRSVIVDYAAISDGPVQVVYRAASPIEVRPNDTEEVTCVFTTPVTGVIKPEEGDDYDPTAPLGISMEAYCLLSLTSTAGRAVATFTNTHPTLSIFVKGFFLEGYTILRGDAQQVQVDSTLGLIPGQREYHLSQNPWVFCKDQAEMLACRLLDLLQQPAIVYTWTGRLCPYLEMGDKVKITNAAQGLSEDCYIVGMQITYGPAPRMSLELIPASRVFSGGPYFVLGSSKYQDPSDEVYY